MTLVSFAAPCVRYRGRRAHGFTLVEMLVTVVIVAILASAVFPLTHMAMRRQKEAQLRQALHDIRVAIDAYKRAADTGHILLKSDQSGFPPTLDALVDGVADAKPPTMDGSTKPRKLYFLRRLPRDPFNEDETLAAADTWTKRCYASSYEEPKEGADVFDVYSQSPKVGLNGQAYKSW